MKKWWQKYQIQILFSLILILAVGIRFWSLGKTPVSLYIDEVALGYDAYSMSETGADHHGHSWPLVAFESYGDWKPSLYFYLVAGSIKIFGLSDWAVRLPSAVAGILSVIGIYFLIKNLWPQKKNLPLWAMLVGAINPWAVHFSHVAFEANVAMMMILWGVVCLVKVIQGTRDQENLGENKNDKNKTQKSSSVQQLLIWGGGISLLILSLYTYHSAKIVAPLLGVFLAIVWLIKTLKNRQNWGGRNWPFLAVALLVTVILSWPLLKAFSSPAIQNRWQETSIFADGSAVLASNNCREIFDFSLPSKIFCHRYLFQAQQLIMNYSHNLNLSFLFWGGDYNNARHSSGFFGLFYPLDLIFIIIGLLTFLTFDYRSVKKSSENETQEIWPTVLIIFWWLISLLPAALSQPSPHAIRILLGWPTWIILIGTGICSLINYWPKYRNKIKTLILILLLIQFGLWSYHYFNIYRLTSISSWDGDQQQLWESIDQLTNSESNLKNIYVINGNSPALFYFYYQKINPQLVQNQETTAQKDKSFFLSFENEEGQNFYFSKSIGGIQLNSNSLIAIAPTKIDELNDFLAQTNFETVMQKSILTDDNKLVWQLITLVEKGYNNSL